jgi:hypothetical protein
MPQLNERKPAKRIKKQKFFDFFVLLLLFLVFSFSKSGMAKNLFIKERKSLKRKKTRIK